MSERRSTVELSSLEQTPLSGLARSLGSDVAKWLPYASKPLPVTLRLTPERHDLGWTRSMLKSLGGKKIPWMKCSESWQMPFLSGNYPDERSKKILTLLHATGRITRQEAVSMLPPVILEAKDGDLVMDTCASPGSKATQLCEAIPNGLVIANEPVSGRLNLLVTNRARLGIHNMLITQHDGRHISRIPSPGLDGVIVDAPCSGTGTSRKNNGLWKLWTPKVGRSMFKLQADIANRAAQLLRPGGKMVYSTCSLDPIENEAVVCEILRKAPWLELIKIDTDRLFPNLICQRGINDWGILDDNGNPLEWDGSLPKLPGLSYEMLNPSQRGEDSPNLEYTIRVNQHENDTGGFFVALFKHVEERTPEKVARSLILKKDKLHEPRELVRKKKNRHSPVKAPIEVVKAICEKWGVEESSFSWWLRGKRISIGPKLILEKIYDPIVYNKKGDYWPSFDFHPLKVIHVGQPTFAENRGIWRTRQESLELIRPHISNSLVEVKIEIIEQLLSGNSPLVEEFPVEVNRGSFILKCDDYLLPVWIAARVSLMIDDNEQEILRMKLGIELERVK